MYLVQEVEENVMVEAAGDLLDVCADHGRCGLLVGAVCRWQIQLLVQPLDLTDALLLRYTVVFLHDEPL